MSLRDMHEIVTVYQPGDRVYTISQSGEVHIYLAQDDGSLLQVHPITSGRSTIADGGEESNPLPS